MENISGKKTNRTLATIIEALATNVHIRTNYNSVQFCILRYAVLSNSGTAKEDKQFWVDDFNNNFLFDNYLNLTDLKDGVNINFHIGFVMVG